MSDNWEVFGVVNNVFNRHDASYGTYFDPSNTVTLLSPPLTDVRNITRLQPVSVQLGLTFKL